MKNSTIKAIVFASTATLAALAIGTSAKADGVLKIPSNAQHIVQNQKNHVQYSLSKGADVSGSGNQTATAPVTVDSQVLSDNNNVVSGVTTVTSDLSKATTNQEASTGFMSGLSSFLLGLNVKATTNTSSNSKWDSTIGVQLKETVYWTKSGSQAKITSVSGSYYRGDQSIAVTSSSVYVGETGGPINTYSLGTASSWSKTVNYGYVPYVNGSAGGAHYTANLLRGSSRWSVTVYDDAWAIGMTF